MVDEIKNPKRREGPLTLTLGVAFGASKCVSTKIYPIACFARYAMDSDGRRNVIIQVPNPNLVKLLQWNFAVRSHVLSGLYGY
ncbi:hypothetical protein N7488_008128 [Penicillium malachiteum]|nr:hypothetical protein N7488_008128 [Penicillium malachiteum]